MAAPDHRLPWRRRLVDAVAPRRGRPVSRPVWWRVAAPAAFGVAGVLFVTSAVSSGGTDLTGTAGRIDDLAGLAASQTRELEGLRARHADLVAEVDGLTASLAKTSAGSAQEEAQALRGPAGLDPVTGPGLTITLTDAPKSMQDNVPEDEVRNLVVHQQDIQAVANALWEGGAEAMTIQDQRVVSTTGIRCVGNSVVLHDVPYAPPYRISAIGPVSEMLDAVNASPYIGFYLEDVSDYGLGWDVQVEPSLDLPAYSGSTGLSYARPAGGLASTDDSGT
ncbi:MAG: DUF881 domain-containing protein [Nocardioides sp.]